MEKSGYEYYTKQGDFVVPTHVNSVFVIAVGGGGGGTNGNQSGGAGGYVRCNYIKVTPFEKIRVHIGPGGQGAQPNDIGLNEMKGCTGGEMSFFGKNLFAEGGGGCLLSQANSGGTGSGATCANNKFCDFGGAGGSNGGNGGVASDGSPGGTGLGDEYWRCLKKAQHVVLTAGNGGSPGNSYRNNYGWWIAGGGGGGVLINGLGPSADDGTYFVRFMFFFLS